MRPWAAILVLVLAGADRCAPELDPGCPWTAEEVGDGCRCTRPSSDLCMPPLTESTRQVCRDGFIRICRDDNREGSYSIKTDKPPPPPPAPRVRRSGSRQ